MTPTRREFLRSVGAGAVLLLGGRRAFAAEEASRPELTFALVSDTHLGRRGSKSPAKWMRQAVEQINDSPADFTIFLGDLVDSGAKREGLYPEWMTIAKTLERPFYSVPGNHDPERFFRKHVRAETDYTVDHGRFRFVFFQNSRVDSHQGTVTPEQLKWLAGQVDDAAAKKLRVTLCGHIISHPNKHPDVGWFIRAGGKEFREMLRAKSETIVAFFAGHFHCGVRGWSDTAGIHEVVMPSTCWNRDRKLEKAPGFAMKEFRRGHVLADVWRDRLMLRYKPIGAKVSGALALELSAPGRGKQ